MTWKARLLGASLAIVCAASAAVAQDEPRCACKHREACYHFLNSPEDPPDDIDPCQKCESGRTHDGREAPDGWNPQCFASGRMDCFLKRHAASWKINCNACIENERCCRGSDHPETCPKCTGDHEDPFARDAYRKDARETMAEQHAIESEFFRGDFVVAYSQHFYVVTDIPRMRIQTDGGGLRWADTHEYAHITLQRAEMAFEEFKDTFRGRTRLGRPMGIYLPKNETTARKLQARYFRAARSHMIYAGYGDRAESRISDGFCLNGFCASLERLKPSASAAPGRVGDDYAVHAAVRHLMGHVLVTSWIVLNGENRTMPRWAFVGTAHWFGKRFERHRANVYYCTGEDQKISGSGKGWLDALKKRASKRKFATAESLLGRSSLGQLEFADHQQVWGWFQYAMTEHESAWVALLTDLRKERDVREAFEDHLSWSPEEFQAAFEAWLLDGDEPDVSEREVVPPEASGKPADIAAMLRSLGVVTDPAEVQLVLDALGAADTDLVRETALSVLLKIEDEAARAVIHEKGLSHPSAMARAYAARACRLLRLKSAEDALRKLHDDAFWLVRSEAALASAAVRDFDAQSAIRAMVLDSSSRARIGAMDALATFGEDVNDICVPLITKNLNHQAWQVRLASAQTLTIIGNHEAVPPLIQRLDKESGRVREALFEALHAISGEDFADDSGRWRKWWDMEGDHIVERGGFTTGVKEPEPTEPGRYAPDETPRYYGEKIFSQRVTFVLDTSRSTNRNFRPDKYTRARLLGEHEEESTIHRIAQLEVEQAISALDPRAMFNVIVFGSQVGVWKKDLVQASGGNKRSGASYARSRSPAGETNFHGALTAALELDRHPLTDSNVRNTADTITVLTDGSPTVGDLIDPEVVNVWYAELNRYSRIRTHVIAFGTLGVNERFLKRLSGRSWGAFVQLREQN